MVLSGTQAALLAALALEPARVFPRAELLAVAFNADHTPGTLDTYVHYLRKKTGKTLIRTLHGPGHQLGDLS